MKNCFTYMLKEEDFNKKLLTVWGINFIGYFLITFNTHGLLSLLFGILAIIAGFVSTGYGVSCIKSFMSNNGLPDVDFSKNLKLGFKLILAVLITFIMVLGLSIIFYLLMKLLYLPVQIILGIFYAIVCLVFLVYALGLSRNFAQTEDLLSYIQFEKVTKQIKENKSVYFKAFLFYLSFTFVMAVINHLFNKAMLLNYMLMGGFVNSLFCSFMTTYTIFVVTYLTAKCMNDKTEPENEV